jgi:cell division protein FtsI/penicillin-binding protein 2
MRSLGTSVAALATGLLVASTVGCGLVPAPSAGDAPGDPADTVGLLVTALEDHTLEGVPLSTGDAVGRFESAIGQLSDIPVRVRSTDVERDGDAASATLRWSWDLGARSWNYDTTVDLEAAARGGERRWVVAWTPAALQPSLSETDVLDVVRTPAPRGDILGAGGRPLVTDRPVIRYGLDKSKIRPSSVRASADRVAEALEIDAAAFRRAARSAGARAFVEAVTLRREEATTAVPPGFADIPGALALPDVLPLAATREFAAPLLGRVGPATTESIEQGRGRVRPGDMVGLSGLQARYDERLSGTPGIEVRATGTGPCADWPDCPDAGEPRTLVSVPAQGGRPVRLTLDEGMQLRAEQALADAGGAASPPSALVAIRPSSGEILVAANGPGNEGLNAATFGQYAPGSTFKIVSALALLRAGVGLDDRVECSPTIEVDGKQFKNYDDYPTDRTGDISFTDAVANSCNTALIGQRGRLHQRALTDAAAALGLGNDYDLGFPAYFGQAPAADAETELAADVIGQGKVLASPMAMAAVAASVAAGHIVVPHLITDAPPQPVAQSPTPLTAREAADLRTLMRAVVTQGSGAFLSDLSGEPGAKTGTAEYGEPAPDGSLPTHTWMIATRGDLAVAVFVETGASGSQTAGPILEDFLR